MEMKERMPGHQRAFRTLFFCLVSLGMGQSMLFAILPPAATEIGLSPFQVSVIFATSATIWVFMSPRWGRRSDVWGRRPVILVGLLGFAVSMTLLAAMIQIGLWQMLPIALVYPLMIASRCVFALFGSGIGPAAQAYVADRTSRSDRTAGVSMVNAAFGMGQTVGPATGALFAAVGLLAPLYLAAATAVVSAGLIWLLLPEAGPPIAAGQPRPPKMSFRDPRVVPFLWVAGALQAVRSTTAMTLAFFLQATLGLSAAETVQHAGAGFVVLALAGLFAQLVLVQRLRPTARMMMVIGTPIAFLSFVLMVVGDSLAAFLVAQALLGIGLGLVRPGTAAGASLAVEPDEQGAVAGLTNALGVVGNIFGPLLGTKLFEIDPHGPFVLNAVLMVLAFAYIMANRRIRAVQ